MTICMIHNGYDKTGGEEVVVNQCCRLLTDHGHRIIRFTRNSAEIAQMRFGRVRAFFTGVYNFAASRAFRSLLRQHRPDLVHVHNVFPLISPSVLVQCRHASLPVVMTVHNYRLVCPNGLHMVDGQVCENCVGGREYWCVLKRCEGSFPKSLGYALRNAAARKLRLFHDNVTLYAALTRFQRNRLIAAGFPDSRIVVIPNLAAPRPLPPADPTTNYVGFVGRISREKGLPVLLAAAALHPHIPFKAAGSIAAMPHLLHQAPPNFQFLGHLDPDRLAQFYKNSRIIVLCSVWFEGFPNVLVEAMLHAKPVICSRIGGLPEIVDHGQTGLLFTPGHAAELADKIAYLYHRPELCRQMGLAAREKAIREYSPDLYYQRLIRLYNRALQLGPGGHSPAPRLLDPAASLTPPSA
jgi:glycosyltransferase involved in cell wall biosynthesis